MPLVSVKLGLTLPVPSKDGGFPYVRVDVEYGDIDTERDVDAQIAECIEATEKVAVSAETAVAQQATNLSGLNFEGLGMADDLKRLKERLNTYLPELKAEVKRQGEALAKLSPEKPKGKKKKEEE